MLLNLAAAVIFKAAQCPLVIAPYALTLAMKSDKAFNPVHIVIAISLEEHEVVSSERDPDDPTRRIERRYMTSDPTWLNGPPYGVVEHVFDEDSLEVCSLNPDE